MPHGRAKKDFNMVDELSSITPDGRGGISVGFESEPKVQKTDDGTEISQVGEGILVDLAPEEKVEKSDPKTDHDANLVDTIEEKWLSDTVEDLLADIQNDKDSRKDWEETYRNGIRQMGLITDKNPVGEPFEGASSVVYPLLSIGVIQFQARAINELFPPKGPVKGSPVGKITEEKLAQSKRVEDHMNYQILYEDKEFFDELDQLLFYLPIGGSAFKKTYFDERKQVTVGKFVRPEKVIIPYTAMSLDDSPRVTHEFDLTPNQMKKDQVGGLYSGKVKLSQPGSIYTSEGTSTARETDDEVDNRSAVVGDRDTQYKMWECCVDLDIPGYKDKDGIALPFIVSIERESRKIIAIRKNWREDDDLKEKKTWFTHYKYLPGTGFYGFGLLHLIGGLSSAATGALRSLLDSAAFATLQGGFKAKDANINAGDCRLSLGEWKDIDLTADELQRAFFTPPFKEPSPAMFQLLGLLVDAGERATSTTEAMVGDAANSGPVGTTLALIEQGSKVYSGIHKRLHNAAGREYRLRAEINFDILEEGEQYPYVLENEEEIYVMKEDYDNRVDILPVSDPKIFSDAQRIARAQGILQLSQQAPEIYKANEAHKRMLTAMGVEDAENLLIDDEPERMDAVSENMVMLTGKQATAFLDQDHDVHIKAHMDFLMHPGYGGHPEVGKIIGTPMQAHIAEHLAYKYQAQMARIGVPSADVNLGAGRGEKILGEEMTAEQEAMISMQAAQAGQQIAQMAGLPRLPEEQEAPPPSEEEIKMMQAQADIKRKDMAAEADVERKNKIAMADDQRKSQQGQSDNMRKDNELSVKAGRDQAEAEAKVLTLEDESDTVLDLMEDETEAKIETMQDISDAKIDIMIDQAEEKMEIAEKESDHAMKQAEKQANAQSSDSKEKADSE